MTKQEKINYAQVCISTSWDCPKDSFAKSENLIFETNKIFFEIVTFGNNAVIRADKEILDWCISNFSNVSANEIMDGEVAAISAADDYHSGFWQIGIDTLDTYRGKGLASFLVKEITVESEKRGKVPLYTTWSPNIASTRTAISTGFYPVWMGYFSEDL